MAKEVAETLTEHYQKTFELTYEVWKERNGLFVYLVITTGMGLLLLLRVPELSSLLVDAVAKFLGITDPVRIAQLYKDFPLDTLLSVVFVIVFYLMQRLYSTNVSVFRNYQYLGALEDEIRQHLALSEDSISFTREGRFYWKGRSVTQIMSKWYYIFVITIVLLPFIILKIMADLNLGNWILILVDSGIALTTLIYFFEYARSSVLLDVPKVPSTPITSGKPDTKLQEDAIPESKPLA